MWIIAPLFCGLIFGAGLLISGMVQPTKVLAFLDIFGAWDPTLAVVMAAALAVAVPGFRLADRGARPWFAGEYFRPGKSGIDLPLVAGAALFGIGWGLVGLCPGRLWRVSRRCRLGSSSSSSRWPQECYFTTPGNSRG
jgi:uncharacterized protein